MTSNVHVVQPLFKLTQYLILAKNISLFFFRLASNAFPDIWSVGQTEKKNKKKFTRSLGIGGPGTPG